MLIRTVLIWAVQHNVCGSQGGTVRSEVKRKEPVRLCSPALSFDCLLLLAGGSYIAEGAELFADFSAGSDYDRLGFALDDAVTDDFGFHHVAILQAVLQFGSGESTEGLVDRPGELAIDIELGVGRQRDADAGRSSSGLGLLVRLRSRGDFVTGRIRGGMGAGAASASAAGTTVAAMAAPATAGVVVSGAVAA